MAEPRIVIFAGILFCLAGIFLFQRNAFEENKKVLIPLLLILAGIVLVGLGTAKRLNLVN